MGAVLKAFEEAEKAAPAEASATSSGSLAEQFDEAARAADAKKKAEAPKLKVVLPPAERPGRMTSFLAGAGTAVGRGALGVQQLVGKGVSKLGEMGDVEALRQAGGWLESDATSGAARLERENMPYAAENPKSNFAGQVTGFVASPVNKLVPAGGAATTLAGAAAKGAAQGAALNVLTSPVEEGKDFIAEKGRQAVIGALGGTAGATLGYTLGGVLNRTIEGAKKLANRLGASFGVQKGADRVVEDAINSLGGNVASVAKERPELFAGLRQIVDDSIKAGKSVDPAAVARLAQSQTLPVPVPMLKGQLTRDPMQWGTEFNLKGVPGVGEPLQKVLQDQNKALIENLNVMGASRGADIVQAAKPVIETLKAADKAANAKVGAAYKAFRDATGKSLDVPLPGLAQDYARVLSEFGETVPGAIRRQFESLGLMAGGATRTFAIEDAEALIKVINKNYDPANRAAARALDELRGAVQKSISQGAGASAEGTAAAGLAKAAREAATGRFRLIEETPALKAALHGTEPDKFLTRFVLQGNEREVGNMVAMIQKQDPKALSALQDSVMAHIKNVVTSGRADENAIFSEAAMKKMVNDPNMRARLTQILGPERMQTLRQLHAVAEDALFAPVASAPNRSNTAAAAANLIQSEVKGGPANEALNILETMPGASVILPWTRAARERVQSSKLSDLVNEAVGAAPARRSTMRLGDLVAPGVRAGTVTAQEESRKGARK